MALKTINVADKITLDETRRLIGNETDDGALVEGSVMGKINHLIEKNGTLDELGDFIDTYYRIYASEYQPETYNTAGTYTTVVPTLAKSVTITACGGGGGGGAGGAAYSIGNDASVAGNGGGGGGGGAAAISGKTYTVADSIKGTTITITVGAAGVGGGASGNVTGNGGNGGTGGNTVIGPWVTLAGGKGGTGGTYGEGMHDPASSDAPFIGGKGGAGGAAGGTGGGSGGNGGDGATLETRNGYSGANGTAGTSGAAGLAGGNAGSEGTLGYM